MSEVEDSTEYGPDHVVLVLNVFVVWMGVIPGKAGEVLSEKNIHRRVGQSHGGIHHLKESALFSENILFWVGETSTKARGKFYV